MKGRLYANWLVMITLFLFFSSLGVFLVYIQDTLVSKQCAFGDDLGINCICTSEGEKICDENISLTTDSREFSTKDLIYSFDFLNFIDINTPSVEAVRFVDISHVNNSLRITVEIESMCNRNSFVAPQIGFYKLEENRLILTTVSNLTDAEFNISCMSENIYILNNFNVTVGDTFRILYQDEGGNIYLSSNCIYEGYIRNSGDVYNSLDGCLLCQCIDEENVCEKERNCLK